MYVVNMENLIVYKVLMPQNNIKSFFNYNISLITRPSKF